MSAEADIQTLLTTDATVAAITTEFAESRIEQDTARPFGVYTRTATQDFEGLDGTVHASKVTLELQLWADTSLQAEQLADACAAAIRAEGHAITGRSTGNDNDLDLEAAILTIEWWE
jgi:hypothetical protein